MVPRDRCGGAELGATYYGRFFNDTEQRAAGVMVDKVCHDGVWHYLFAVPATYRPDLPSFTVELAEAPGVSLRCGFTYLTRVNGLKRATENLQIHHRR